ncbi:hypothetical protein A1O1_04119 [Capronia coronata CBS 617.96]|uniref:Uncharacterized protein n=1 Tax=Capronia coronata CBS 617.96 TaxID=1182541 RepID=W9YDQ8_9EURO|nr:uncharacterized protein A1O1_04119 [Capronia coronata CBS 617.96]EXJ91012.1 hypothetical protein A1O1_04119 [Capronia coronata CBS 617.96]
MTSITSRHTLARWGLIDLVVEALRSMGKFIHSRYNEKDVVMVISVEVDQQEFQNHTILERNCHSFFQWRSS